MSYRSTTEMSRNRRPSSLTEDFLEWSPDFGPAQDSENINLPSVLHPIVLEEPLLPSGEDRTSSRKYSQDDEYVFVDDDEQGLNLVDRAHELSESVRYRLLAQLVGDGLHTRQFAITLKTEKALWWYEYSHSFQSRGMYSLSMIFFLLLVFVEAPSSNPYTTRNAIIPPAITVFVECILIGIVWIDIYAQVRYQDTEWRQQLCRRTWLRGRGFVALVITIDLLLVVLPFPVIVRFSRPFRVWLLLSRLRNLRNAVSMAFRTLPNVSLIGGFLMFLVVLFSLVGWLIFDPANEPWKQINFNTTKSGLCSTFTPVCNGYFDTFPNTLYQMWILLGGINYPDIALPYLNASYLSSLFFVAYLTLGQIFLMRLLITAAYGAYREELFKRVQKRENRTHLAFSAAFDILVTEGYDGIELHQWLRLVQEVRPKFRIEVARAIFVAAEVEIEDNSADSQLRKNSNKEETEGEINESRKNNRSDKTNIEVKSTEQEQQQEEDILQGKTNSKISIVPIVTSYERFVEMLHMLDVQTGKRTMSKQRWAQPGCIGNIRRCSWFIYKRKWVRRSFDLLALFSVARLILVRTNVAPGYGRCAEHYVSSCSFDIIGYCVMGLFCLEQIIKIAALGWREYWVSWLNRLDFGVSATSISATVIVDIASPLNHSNEFLIFAQIIPIVRLLKIVGQVVRLIRLFRFSNKAKRMLALVTHVIPNAMRLLAIIASALYFYSVVGMELFAGCLSNQTLVEGSSYDVQNMHPLNFDTFGESLMTSFTMLLVRKYPVLLEGTIACYENMLWPMVFYFSFYIIVVCFLLNVFVAFILAVFNEVESVQRLDDEYRRQELMERQSHHKIIGETDEHTNARRNPSECTSERTSEQYSIFHEKSILNNDTIKQEINDDFTTTVTRSRKDSMDSFSKHGVISPRRMERAYSQFNNDTSTSNTGSGNHLHHSRGSIYLRGKVQDLLLRNEDPYKNALSKQHSTSSIDMIHNMFGESETTASDQSTGNNNTPSRIILKSSGPRARDVEALMLKRHKASNSGGSQYSFVSIGDMISNMSSIDKKRDTMKQVLNIASVLGVNINQITISGNISNNNSPTPKSRRAGYRNEVKRNQLSSRSVGIKKGASMTTLNPSSISNNGTTQHKHSHSSDNL